MSEHVTSKKSYTYVFAALMALLVLSIWTGQIQLGAWSLPVAMAISICKTLLIALFFMHLLHSTSLTRVMALGGLVWLTILAALTFSDYTTRDWRTDAWRTYHPRALDRADRPDRADNR